MLISIECCLRLGSVSVSFANCKDPKKRVRLWGLVFELCAKVFSMVATRTQSLHLWLVELQSSATKQTVPVSKSYEGQESCAHKHVGSGSGLIPTSHHDCNTFSTSCCFANVLGHICVKRGGTAPKRLPILPKYGLVKDF